VKSRLLIVDDNPGYRRLVRMALDEDPVFDVVAEAGSAEDAVAVLDRLRPDIALVDVLLPSGQGFRLPGVLRKAVPSCIVVLTSAHPDGDLAANRQLGGIAFLPKSVPPSELGRELGALVSVISQVQDARQEAFLQLPASQDSPRAARRFVERILAEWGCDELVDIVTLLVSELVGNAVLHAGSDIDLSVRLMAERLRVDVIDRSALLPRRRDATDDEQTGRGSGLVERLTAAWGVTGRPDGKSVWFEMAVPNQATTSLSPPRPGSRTKNP